MSFNKTQKIIYRASPNGEYTFHRFNSLMRKIDAGYMAGESDPNKNLFQIWSKEGVIIHCANDSQGNFTVRLIEEGRSHSKIGEVESLILQS